MFATKLVDTDALLSVIWISFAAAVGGTAAFSIAIAGAARFTDMRRAGRTAEATMFAALAALALALCAAGGVFGLYEIIKK